MKRKIFFWLAALVILAEIGDEFLKSFLLNKLPDEGSLVDPAFFTLAIHRNYGIVFDIPFKLPLIVGISVVVTAIMAVFLVENWYKARNVSLFTLIILIGAAGNMFDRIIYGFTVDYLLIVSRLAINFSDILIVAGVAGILFATRKQKPEDNLTKTENQVE